MFAVIYVKNLSKCRNHMPVLNQFVGIAFILDVLSLICSLSLKSCLDFVMCSGTLLLVL